MWSFHARFLYFTNVFKSFNLSSFCGLSCMHGVKRLLWWLLSGSAGGLNRGRILEELFIQPRNANELANFMKFDYLSFMVKIIQSSL